MIRSLNDLKNYEYEARDGAIGRVRDFYFDDRTWTVRYVVLETGRWLFGRRVLVSPEAIESTDWNARRVRLGLSKQMIEDAPAASTHEPVSTQHIVDLHAHYGWPLYWTIGPSAMDSAAPVPAIGDLEEPQDGPASADDIEVHLRSVDEVTGYSIAARDGAIGSIDDFGCEEASWKIRYLVADTRKWLPGKRVVLSPDWVERIDWREREVRTELHRSRIEQSPPFDPMRPINREYEEVLYDFYGRPKYWTEGGPHAERAQSS